MGLVRRILGLDLEPPTVDPDEFQAAHPEVFDVTPTGVAALGVDASTVSVVAAPKIDRRSAMQVPAVKRVHDLVAGTLGGLPIDVMDTDRRPIRSLLLEQPERNVPRSVTMTRLFGDLLLEQIAWWDVVETTWDKWPLFVKRLAPGRVTVDDERGKVFVDGRERTDLSTLIRFDSPSEGLLTAGARAIRTCLLLENYAANAAAGIPPMDYFSPAEDGVDPFASSNPDEDEAEAEEKAAIGDFLAEWQEARRTRSTAYVPAALKYQTAGFDPKALQLTEQRAGAVLEIARLGGVDPEDLGVSTTSRTYANMFERRKAFTDFTLGLYRQAVEDRLSMGDVTPRGQYVKFNLDAFLRSDPLARYQAMEIGLRIGAIDQSEIRPLEDKPQIVQPATPAALRAVPTRQENAS